MQTKKNLFFGLLFIFAVTSSYAQLQTDSLKICALRVDFVADQNELTTGNGLFMLDSISAGRFAIDPPPHNRLYFQDQIQAAANYYSNVSNGKLHISGDVYPVEESGAFHLDHEMGYYNPNTTNEAINLGIANLFRDAVTAADRSGAGIDFSNYDLVVVFHAGVGKDIDLPYDETPQDISSLYVTKKFLKQALGQDFNGVSVNNGLATVSSGVILPETESQDDFELALTGMFVSNIGSHLGLYDLFSPSKQRSGIGHFGVMDAGLFNMGGLVPAPPSAFSRKLLGWETPQIYTSPRDQIKIARYGSPAQESYPTLVEIPINEDEYFLLEYRGDYNVNMDSLYNILNTINDEPPNFMELLKTYFSNKIEISPRGVLLSVPDYDWGLSGGGILIWHIDESIIAEKGLQNKINDDPDYRAVDLEEADAAQDIGESYSFMDFGYQKELGWFADFWFANRPEYLENWELYKNEFSPRSKPNSNSNRGRANSHITIKNFSNNLNDIMTFDFQRDFYEANFPLNLLLHSDSVLAVNGGKVDNKQAYYFCASGQGNVFAVGKNGAGLFFEGKKNIAGFSATSPELSLALGDASGDDSYDFLALASADSLYAFSLTQSGPDSLAAFLFPPIKFNAQRQTPLVIANNNIYVGCANDTLYTINLSGQVVDELLIRENTFDFVVDPAGQPMIPGEFSNFVAAAPLHNGQAELISLAAGNEPAPIVVSDGSHSEYENHFRSLPYATGQFALADADGNGTYDVIYNTAKALYAFNREGYILDNFPIDVQLTAAENLIGTPLVVDADNDGSMDFIMATNYGRIIAVDGRGRPVENFPLSSGGMITQSPMILQMDEDSALELLAITNNGTLNIWQLQAQQDAITNAWPQENLNGSNNAYIALPLIYKPVTQKLMPAKRVYNYPNPNSGSTTKIRYYLNDDAQVSIRIYDAAGTPVDSFTGPGKGGAANEVHWDVSGVASGIYLCHVKAKSEKETSEKIIKIMVIH